MSPSLPLVSVIIPVYNHEKFVVEALNSVINQSYPHIEMIIIDDGSSDNSISIIDEWMNSWKNRNHSSTSITFIKQENRGAHATINRGLSLAKGDFLTILNSDDYYHLDRIRLLIDKVAGKGEIGFSLVKAVNENGNTLPQNHPWMEWYECNIRDLINWPTIGFKLLHVNIAVSSGNLFFSKTLYQRIGEFKNLKLAHDLDFLLRAVALSEPIFLEERLYFYRIHHHNTFHQVNSLLSTELKEIYREYVSLVAKAPPENRSAPCHWHWPYTFPATFLELKMDVGLKPYLCSLNEPSKASAVLEPLQHLPQVNRKKHPKITIISHELSLTGAPKVVVDLAILLKNKGYLPNVLTFADGPMKKELEKQGIACETLPKTLVNWAYKNKKWKKAVALCLLLPLLFMKTKKHVICNTIITWTALFPLSLLKWKSTFMWYIHDSYSPSVLIPQKVLHFLKKKSNVHIWFGSQSTQKIWQEADVEGKIHYWSGIPRHPTYRQKTTPIKHLLSVGTFSPRKGTHYLIDAFITCIKKGLIPDDVTLTLVGFSEDPFYRTFNNEQIFKIIQAGVQERIKIVASVSPDQLKAYYDQADLFIQSSILECLPISLLTAMAVGLPIISTNANGCVEVIKHLQTGYLCESRSSQALTDRIAQALEDPLKTRELGKAAQHFFNEKLCLEESQKTILDDLKELV